MAGFHYTRKKRLYNSRKWVLIPEFQSKHVMWILSLDCRQQCWKFHVFLILHWDFIVKHHGMEWESLLGIIKSKQESNCFVKIHIGRNGRTRVRDEYQARMAECYKLLSQVSSVLSMFDISNTQRWDPNKSFEFHFVSSIFLAIPSSSSSSSSLRDIGFLVRIHRHTQIFLKSNEMKMISCKNEWDSTIIVWVCVAYKREIYENCHSGWLHDFREHLSLQQYAEIR